MQDSKMTTISSECDICEIHFKLLAYFNAVIYRGTRPFCPESWSMIIASLHLFNSIRVLESVYFC